MPVVPRHSTPTVVMSALPRGPLSPQEQARALQKTLERRERRIRLGPGLHQTAEATVDEQGGQSDALESIRRRLDALDRTITEAAGRTTDIEERLSRRLARLEDRLDALQQKWHATNTRVEELLAAANRLIDRSALNGQRSTVG